MNKRAKGFVADQSGAMAVMAALLLTVLLSAAALGIDYGHMTWVQGDLKRPPRPEPWREQPPWDQAFRTGPQARLRRPQSSNRIKRRANP